MTRAQVLLCAGAAAAALAHAGRPSLRASDSVGVASLKLSERARMRTVPGQLIVQFREAADERVMERAMRETGAVRARRSVSPRRYLVTLDEGLSVATAVSHLGRLPEVDYAEPNGVVRALQTPPVFTPNDRLYGLQWHMRQINAERTWAIQQGARSVAVAVLDTGIAYEDFGPYRTAPDWGETRFLQGFDFINNDTHANDDNFHGTHVASTIAEATNNGDGVAGLAFGCNLMPVKVLDEEGLGSFFEVAEGIDYAVGFSEGGNRPVKVINLSLGGEGSSQTVTRAVDRAIAAGITVVAAAGNDGVGTISFPASHPAVISVGALDARKQRAPYSNTGRELDVVAPGGNIDRDDDNDGRPDGVLQQSFDPDVAAFEGRFDDFAYFFVEGTSQATPHVAALAALLISQGITQPAAVQAAIESTAEDLGTAGRDDQFGHGLIRPAEALKGLGLNR
jgi:serine protease